MHVHASERSSTPPPAMGRPPGVPIRVPGWAVDDLPGGDLLRHEGVQHLYLAQGTSVDRLHEHSTFPSVPDHANLLEARLEPEARLFEPIFVLRHRYHRNLPIPSSDPRSTQREVTRTCVYHQQGEGTPKSGDSGDGGDDPL